MLINSCTLCKLVFCVLWVIIKIQCRITQAYFRIRSNNVMVMIINDSPHQLWATTIWETTTEWTSQLRKPSVLRRFPRAMSWMTWSRAMPSFMSLASILTMWLLSRYISYYSHTYTDTPYKMMLQLFDYNYQISYNKLCTFGLSSIIWLQHK